MASSWLNILAFLISFSLLLLLFVVANSDSDHAIVFESQYFKYEPCHLPSLNIDLHEYVLHFLVSEQIMP